MITQQEIHQNAINKGFWDETRIFSRSIGLIHSEISEALEELRDGRNLHEIYYSEKGKPCGVPIELADIIIRIMDIAENYEFNVEDLLQDDSANYGILSDDMAVLIISLHGLLPPISYYGTEFDEWEDHAGSLQDVVSMVNQICKISKINLIDAIEIKHKYNLTRIQKHGKLF